ncbi:MAG: M28 family peptidase [Gemmatimonadaceae bacterium]|nr:M28 family peptidase [Gemmatimonadaceae bacterium]
MRCESANLEAGRGEPKIWLTAHLDSKSQSVPILVRAASSTLLLFLFVVAIGIAALRPAGVIFPAWHFVQLLAVMAGVPSLLCLVGNRSAGAVDNASGVAAVILAARSLPSSTSVGVLITSGEELDLAGARAWAVNAAKGSILINCDTVDDAGEWQCMWTRDSGRLCEAARAAAARIGISVRSRRSLPGILTDSIAFACAGLTAVTISRGSLLTLARIHTARDNTERLCGRGAAAASQFLAEMVTELS